VNVATVSIPGATDTDPSSYCNPPPTPDVSILTLTNGADANNPNAGGVPNIPQGSPVTWTYRVTNTGETHVPRAMVLVTDNVTGVSPTFTSEISGNGDTIFDPGEVWLYTATGTALDLAAPPPAGTHIVPGQCTKGGVRAPSNAYTNLGTASIPGAQATDPSSYCNPPQGGQITPTNVDCTDVLAGTAPNLPGIFYPNSGGKVGQGINPGVFFYWTKVTIPAGMTTLTTSQSNTSTNGFPNFQIHQGWQRLYTANCSSYVTGTQINGGTAASFSVTPGTSYILGIKYNVKSVVGANVPVPPTITFNFSTSVGGSTSAKVDLSPAH
jgi:hypothetical protein